MVAYRVTWGLCGLAVSQIIYTIYLSAFSYPRISKIHLNAILLLVPRQFFFFLIHVFPKAPISSFLCSVLLLLPNHSYEAEKNNNNKNFKTLVASTSGLTY